MSFPCHALILLSALAALMIGGGCQHVPQPYGNDKVPGADIEVKDPWNLAFDITLPPAGSADGESYILMERPTFCYPRVVCVESRGKDIYATFKQTDGKGGYYPGRLIIDEQRQLTCEERAVFRQLLSEARIWTTDVKSAMSGLDGTTIVLDAYADGRHREVSRWSPPSGPFYELWHFMTGLFDWEAEMEKPYVRRHFNQLQAYMAAAEAGDLKALRKHLRHGMPVDVIYDHRTALSHAVDHGRVEAVRLLTEAGADLQPTHLQAALKAREFEVVRLLLDYGMDPKDASQEGDVCRSFSWMKRGDLHMVRALVSRGLDLERCGESVFASALRCGDLEVTRYLVQLGVRPWDTDNSDALFTVIKSSENEAERIARRDILSYLIRAGAPTGNIDSWRGDTLLHASVAADNEELMEALLKAKAIDVNILRPLDNQSAVHTGAIKGYLHIIQRLHAHGAKLNIEDTYGNRPISYAIQHGHEDVAAWLLQQGCQDDAIARLMRAVEHADEDVVRSLLAGGAPVNAVMADEKGCHATPLLTAVLVENPRMVNLLLNAGADPNQGVAGEASTAKDEFSFRSNCTFRSPLIAAVRQDRLDLVKSLCIGGAHLQSSGGTPPLVQAAESRHVKVAAYLLSQGATVDSRDELGQTALMKAVRPADIFGDDDAPKVIDMVKLLLQHGADVHLRDTQGRTALMHCADNGQSTDTTPLEVLIAAGSELSAVDKDGLSALSYALMFAANGRTEWPIHLIRAGCAVDVPVPWPIERSPKAGESYRVERPSALEFAKASEVQELVDLIEARLRAQ